MQNKYLNSVVFFCGFISLTIPYHAEAGSAYDNKLLGKCFDTAKEFLFAAYGEKGGNDENIEVSDSMIDGKTVTWVVDKTPMTNYQWFLLENSKQQICLRLFVPAASLVEAMPTKVSSKTAPRRMRAFIGPGPGFPAKQIIFRYSNKQQIFWPERCIGTWLTETGKIKYSKQISCETIFD